MSTTPEDDLVSLVVEELYRQGFIDVAVDEDGRKGFSITLRGLQRVRELRKERRRRQLCENS